MRLNLRFNSFSMHILFHLIIVLALLGWGLVEFSCRLGAVCLEHFNPRQSRGLNDLRVSNGVEGKTDSDIVAGGLADSSAGLRGLGDGGE